jgi:uncharacterized protein YbaR (Trm112 family)
MSNKSDHKHNYSENVIVRHWYRGGWGIRYFCGTAKRCPVCNKVKHEKFDWNILGEEMVNLHPDYPIVDEIPRYLADEVEEILNNK